MLVASWYSRSIVLPRRKTQNRDQSSQGFCDKPIAIRWVSLGHRLKSTGYKMYQDLPYGIVERRRKQMDAFKTAKSNKIPASFSKSQPDKLYVLKRKTMAYRQTSWCVFQLTTCFLPQKALTVTCQNLIHATKPYFTKHLFIHWFTLAAGERKR